MKRQVNKSVFLALLIAALFALGPAPGALAKEATLSLSAARSAARGTAWEVARRNPSLNSVKLGGCNRRAPDRLVCLALDHGSTSTLATTCRVWIRVEGTDQKPKATVSFISCKNHRWALLRAADAEAAILAEAQRIGGPVDIQFGILGRLSRVEIAGTAGWERPNAADPAKAELCLLELRAVLVGDEVQVHVSRPLKCVLPTS